jgi:cytochrome c oxidase assembly protein subunit 15
MQLMARTSLLLVLVLVSLSAYLRLAHSGLGCEDWPACYGRIGEPPAATQPRSEAEAYEKIVVESNQALAWATPLHRLVASVLGLFIFGMTMTSFMNKKSGTRPGVRAVCVALMALTVYLAILGLKSGSLHSPAVVMGNLIGGFAMLGLLGWLVFSQRRTHTNDARVRLWTNLAIVMLAAQIVLGGLTSANFAATACQTLPDCHGSWLPGPALTTALDLSRDHQVTASGFAVGGPERADIHMLHRIGALVALVVILVAALAAIRGSQELRVAGWLLLLLVVFEFAIGLAAVVTRLPISIAVAHNWMAGMLMLSLLYQQAGCRAEPKTMETP